MTHDNILSKLLGALLLCSAVMLPACELDPYPPAYGGYGETDDYPPADYIATTAPVYYEGRPAYHYHDHWYYRDRARGGWASYHREPRELERRRVVEAPRAHGYAAPPARRYYGRQSVGPQRGQRRR
jgi:hypothetical protein